MDFALRLPAVVYAVVAVILLVCGPVALALSLQRRRGRAQIKALIEGEFWVHWRYDAAEWTRWAESVRGRDGLASLSGRDRFLVWALSPLIVFATLALLAATEPLGVSVLLITGALSLLACSVLPVSVWLRPKLRARRILRSAPEVWIGPRGAFHLGRYIPWNRRGRRLCAVKIEPNPPSELVFAYLVELGDAPMQYQERILIPPGAMDEAQMLAARLNRSAGWRRVKSDAIDLP